MRVKLVQAQEKDIKEIREMQAAAFLPLLEKYRDYETSPACESEEKIRGRFRQPETEYFLIQADGKNAGAMRVVTCGEGVFRIAPVFILPPFQNQGIAQEAFRLVEERYPEAVRWRLDTILQESRNCHLYEKIGYRRTGEVHEINERMTLVDYMKEISGDDVRRYDTDETAGTGSV